MPDENIDGFLGYLANETTARGRTSKETVKCYKLIIKQFLNHINKKPELINKNDIESWKDYCKKYKDSSLVNKYSAVKKYIRYLIDNEILDERMESAIKKLKTPIRDLQETVDKETLTEEHVESIFNVAEPMEKAMFMTFYYGFPRRNEVCNLNLNDIDYENKTMTIVNGKGGKTRTVNLTQRCIDAIKDYVDYYRETPRKGHEHALFLHDGRRLSRTMIHTIHKIYEQKANLPIHLHPHLWRHTGISHYAKKEKDVKILMKQTRHARTDVLMKYIDKSKEEYRNSYDSAFGNKEPEKPEPKTPQPQKKPDVSYAQTPQTKKEELLVLYDRGILTFDEFLKRLESNQDKTMYQ